MIMFSLLYTFDVIDGCSKIAIDMLILSIVSVKREFKDSITIFIYSTNTDNVKKEIYNKIKQTISNIEFRHYDCNKYNHIPFNFIDINISRFNNIGHSRHFLIKELLLETKKPVIYMDNDTIFSTKSNDTICSYIKKEYPTLYNIELTNTYASLIDYENSLSTFNNLYDVYDDIRLLKFRNAIDKVNVKLNKILRMTSRPYNNGVMIFPYNTFSFIFIEKVIDIYNILSINFDSMFNDMLAVSIIANLYKKNINVIYNHTSENKESILHYYNIKTFINEPLFIKNCIIIFDNFNNNRNLVDNIIFTEEKKLTQNNSIFSVLKDIL